MTCLEGARQLIAMGSWEGKVIVYEFSKANNSLKKVCEVGDYAGMPVLSLSWRSD